MEESVEDYLALCAEVGKDPERPYRGEFLVRTTPEVHRAVASAAEAAGVSLNAWVESTISATADERGVAPTPRTGISRRTTAKRKKATAKTRK